MATVFSRVGGAVQDWLRGWLRTRGVILATSTEERITSSPIIESGTGAASGAVPDGSIWVRTDGPPEFMHLSSWRTLPLAGSTAGRMWSALEDFFGMADTEAEHGWVLNSGADAQALDPAIDTAQAGGVFQLVTGDADGTTANDGSGMVWGDMPIQLDSAGGDVAIEWRVRIKTAITDVSVGFGLTDATTLEEPFTNSADTITSTATDAVGFLYDTDATTDEWWACAVDSDTDDTANATTGTAPVADTWQTFRIEISNDGATIRFYIDGTLELTFSGDAGVGPDAVLYPYIIACATTTTSKTIDVDYCEVSGVR